MVRIEVAGCLIVKDGKLLVLWKRKRGHYELPGGKIDAGETPEQAAVREAKEEIGCDVILLKKRGTILFPGNSGVEIFAHRFLAELKPDQIPRVMELDVFDHLLWMPIRDHADYAVAPNVAEFCISWLHKGG